MQPYPDCKGKAPLSSVGHKDPTATSLLSNSISDYPQQQSQTTKFLRPPFNKKSQTTKLPRSKRDLSTDRQTKALKNGERHHIADLAILQHNGLIQCLRR